MATLFEALEIPRISFHLNKNARLERDLKQVLFIDSAETTHHSPAKPAVVSTSQRGTEVETGHLNAYGSEPVRKEEFSSFVDLSQDRCPRYLHSRTVRQSTDVS